MADNGRLTFFTSSAATCVTDNGYAALPHTETALRWGGRDRKCWQCFPVLCFDSLLMSADIPGECLAFRTGPRQLQVTSHSVFNAAASRQSQMMVLKMWLIGKLFGGHFGLPKSRIESARPCAGVNLVNSNETPLAEKEHLLPLPFLALLPVP